MKSFFKPFLTFAVCFLLVFSIALSPLALSPAAALEPPYTDMLVVGIQLAEEAMAEPAYEQVIPIVKARFETALTTARNVLAAANASPPTATQDDVDAAFFELMDAMTYLSYIQGDKTKLGELIAESELLQQLDYTSSTWGPFETELGNAMQVFLDENAMQHEVEVAYDALLAAKNALVDLSALRRLYADESPRVEAEYTPESWAPFARELAGALAVLQNPSATQAEVDDAYDLLFAAAAALVRVAPPNPPGAGDGSGNGDGSSPSSPPHSVPNTGDGTATLIWAFLALALSAAMAATALRLKRQRAVK